MTSKGSISSSGSSDPPTVDRTALRPSAAGAGSDRESAGRPSREPPRGGRSWLPAGVLALIPFCFASFFPAGPVWGFNVLAPFDPWTRVVLLLGCFLLLIAPVLAGRGAAPPEWLVKPSGTTVIAAGLVFLVLFRLFPIATDMYGDHRNMLTWHADNARFDPAWWGSVISPSIYATKEALAVAVARTAAFLFRLPVGDAYAWVAALSGVAVVTGWMILVPRFVPDPWTSLALTVAGLCAGGHLVFFGHVETYPLAAALSFAFLAVSFVGFSRPVPAWLLVLLFLLAFRAHALNGLLAGGLGVALVHAMASKRPAWRRLLTWRAQLFLLLPLLVVAAVAGVAFVRRDHPESHLLELVLPVRRAAPPHGNYLLQSGDHLLDVLNALVLVGIPALALVTGCLFLHRTEPRATAAAGRSAAGSPRLLWAVMSLAVPLPFFYALNTQLGPARDWDIFALLSPPLLFLALALAARDRAPLAVHRSALGVVLALSVFPLAGAYVNARPPLVSRRLQEMGEWSYRSYYTGSAYMMVAAIRMEPDRALRRARLEAVLDRMKPAVRERDTEYAHVLAVLSEEYAYIGEIEGASRLLERSLEVCPDCSANRDVLVELYLDFDNPEAARPHVEEMMRRDPESLDAVRRALVVAMMTVRIDEVRALHEKGVRLGLEPGERKAVEAFLEGRAPAAELR